MAMAMRCSFIHAKREREREEVEARNGGGKLTHPLMELLLRQAASRKYTPASVKVQESLTVSGGGYRLEACVQRVWLARRITTRSSGVRCSLERSWRELVERQAQLIEVGVEEKKGRE